MKSVWVFQLGECSREWGLSHRRLCRWGFVVWCEGWRAGVCRWAQCPKLGIGAEEVRQILGGEGMERFIGQEENFVIDTWFNWEPVKADESRGEVLPGLGAGENPGNRVLHILEPVQGFGREPRQDSITVVQAGGDEGMDDGLSHRFGERGLESGDVFEMIKSWFSDGFYMWLKR